MAAFFEELWNYGWLNVQKTKDESQFQDLLIDINYQLNFFI